MVFIKRTTICFVTILLTGALLGYLYYDELTGLVIINSVFITSMLDILFGAMMFVTRGGFFDGIILSFRRFMQKGTKMGSMMEDADTMALPSEAFEYAYTEPMLIAGFLGFLVTLVISYLGF